MSADRARLAPLGLVFLFLLLSGCAVALGPGYQLRRETMGARYQPGAPPALGIETDSVVRNVGNRALGHMRLQLPVLFPAAAQVNAQVAGRTVTPLAKTVAGQTQVIVPFHPPLARGQSLRFRLSYEITMPAREFVLEPHDWFARFLPPPHLFAKGQSHADETALNIFVPAGYRALVGGKAHGVRHGRPAGETEYRFSVSQGDFPPFLAVGKFREFKVGTGRRDVVFWTLQPIGPGCARRVAAHLAATADLYRKKFGRLHQHRFAIPVVELPPGGGSRVWNVAGGFGSVPEGITFDMTPAQLCGQPERYFPLADRALAATWFGWAVAPEPEARGIFGSGARRYAAFVAEQGNGGAAAQARQVRTWIEEYDRLRSVAQPLAPIGLGAHPLPAQRRMAGIQSALCLIALQGRFGAGAVQRALAHLVSSLQGSTAGLDDVRSALEQEANQNLFDFMGKWLGQAGIPPAFRRQYAARMSKGAHTAGSILNSRRAR